MSISKMALVGDKVILKALSISLAPFIRPVVSHKELELILWRQDSANYIKVTSDIIYFRVIDSKLL
jgi:hypothetical protein